MAQTPEARHTGTVCDKLDKSLVRAWKIFDTITSGKPDSEFTRRDGKPGRTLKIEFKYLPTLPVRATTLVTPKWQNDLQREWLGNYYTCDRSSLAVIFVGNGRTTRCVVFVNKKEWDLGLTKEECERRAISTKDCALLITYFVTNGEHGALPPCFSLSPDGLEVNHAATTIA